MTQYVWIKRDLFECPKHQGYTGIRDCAGTWPLEDAQRFGLPIKEAYDRSHEHYALPIEAAPEFTNACFDDLARDHLKAKCAAKDAEIARLRESLEKIAGQSGQFGFPWPETHVDYPAFALLTARDALKDGSDAAL